ncbi:MAG: DUF2283 domain-containing protein [Rubrobacteraceae bacterium]
MRISYHPDMDSLYIHLSDRPGAEIIEVSDDVAVDVDENGVPVGIDISQNASGIVDLSKLKLERSEEDGSDALLELATGFLVQPVEVTGKKNVG